MLVLEMKRQMPSACVGCSFFDDVCGVCLPTEESDEFFHVFDFDPENASKRAWNERDPRCPLKEVECQLDTLVRTTDDKEGLCH